MVVRERRMALLTLQLGLTGFQGRLKTNPHSHPRTSGFSRPWHTRGFMYSANPRPALIAMTADVARARRVISPTVVWANPDKAEPSPPFIMPLLIFPQLVRFPPLSWGKVQESLSPAPQRPPRLRVFETFHDMPANTATGNWITPESKCAWKSIYPFTIPASFCAWKEKRNVESCTPQRHTHTPTEKKIHTKLCYRPT